MTACRRHPVFEQREPSAWWYLLLFAPMITIVALLVGCFYPPALDFVIVGLVGIGMTAAGWLVAIVAAWWVELLTRPAAAPRAGDDRSRAGIPDPVQRDRR